VLDERKDEEAVNASCIGRYNADFDALQDELVFLHSNLRLLSQLRQFPAGLFEAPTALFSFLIHNLTTECVLICCRLWRDKPRHTLTLDRFADWLVTEGIRPDVREELKIRLEAATPSEDTQKTIDNLRTVRHARLAHLDHLMLRGLKSPPTPVPFRDLEKTAGALGRYLNAMAFGSEHHFVLIEFFSQNDEWHEGDLGYVLDRLALGSKWFTALEQHPDFFWSHLRPELGPDELQAINSVRTRYQMEPLR